MKDNFSSASDLYAKYRPTYPQELFDFIQKHVNNKITAWDCGTGNGQVAYELAKTFQHVYASDISQSQLDHALLANNISYSLQPAENTNYKNNAFDLIVIAQAIHWFDFEKFYQEAKRTAKENAIIAVIGYGRITISKEIDEIISNFYTQIIGPFWDKERKYIDENYATIPFPFQEIEAPKFENKHLWNFNHLIGYLNTWSAVKHFKTKNGFNPIDKLRLELEKHWHNNEEKEITFPILLRLGFINN